MGEEKYARHMVSRSQGRHNGDGGAVGAVRRAGGMAPDCTAAAAGAWNKPVRSVLVSGARAGAGRRSGSVRGAEGE